MLLRVYLVASGKTVSENSLEFFFYPEPPPELPPPVSFHDPAGRLRRLVNEMRAHNYLAPSGKEAMPVLITSTFDDEVKEALRRGGLVILMPSDRQPLPGGLEIVPRSADNLDGNWISAFSWIRKDHTVFRAIGFDTLAGFEMQAVAPITVVRGIPPELRGCAGRVILWLDSFERRDGRASQVRPRQIVDRHVIARHHLWHRSLCHLLAR